MDQQFELPPDDEESSAPERSAAADPTEGVRIIGAEEAAEAMERGDVTPRRGGDQPRYGDRPPPPPMGPRPALRFPLDVGADPTRIERPPVQPAPDPEVGPVELPHWTEPPTGEVPTVLIGDSAPLLEESDEDLDAWSSFASSSPRWRDADDSWDEDQTDFVAGLAHDDESRVGALEDPDARPTHDEFFSFDDLEEQTEERISGATRVAGSHADEPEATPAPLWASVPDADDFHDATALDNTSAHDATAPEDASVVEDAGGPGDTRAPQDTSIVEATGDPAADDAMAEEDWKADLAEMAGPGSDTGRAGGVYDAEDDTDAPGGEWDVPYEKPGGRSARAARRRTPRKPRGKDEKGGGGRDLGTAVVVGVLLVAVFAGLLSIGPGWAMILVALVIFLAAGEFFDALRRAGYGSATLFGLVGCTAFPLAVYWRGPDAFPIVMVLAFAGCLLWYLAGSGGPEARVLQGAGTTVLGIVWIGGLGSFAAAMLRAPDGRALLVIAVLATVGYDVGGFFIGRNAGHRQLSDASPNKTVEGLLGGMFVCVVVVVIAVGAVKLGPWDGYRPALAIGLGAAIAAPLGDLCQSLVKRDLGLKDMSTMLPGHGGVFDRFDAMLFVLPTIYYLVTIVGHRI